MDAKLLQEKFARMGARLRVGAPKGRAPVRNLPLTLDVGRDADGEFFDVALRPGTPVDVNVLQVLRRERHLLLQARTERENFLYLCGHDERHWFVAAVPEGRGASNVATAMEALKPPEVLAAQARQSLNGKERRQRKNAAYRRQGEWFFLPDALLKVDKRSVLVNEPLSRGTGSKPHIAEYCYRQGGETVHVCAEYPTGLRPEDYRRVLAERPEAKKWPWRVMRRNAVVFVKGRISHPDHDTIVLHVWHRVLMNTESQARAMQHVVFLD